MVLFEFIIIDKTKNNKFWLYYSKSAEYKHAYNQFIKYTYNDKIKNNSYDIKNQEK